jgi:acetate kinase
MKILVINSGSSSIKYQLFDMTTRTPLTSGIVERIGQEGSRVKHKLLMAEPAGEIVQTHEIRNHQQGLELVAGLLMDKKDGVISKPEEIAAVGHRVVHGGELFSQTTIINQAVKDKVRELIPLAPLHNPANLEGIEVSERIFGGATQVAVFDTAFHQTMPATAYRYALPEKLYRDYGIRSYGFHGTSHLYVSKVAAAHLGKAPTDTNLISAHLGNGASITAIKGGRSIDTSMGFSPLPGLIMGTRSGDIDPAIVYYLGTKVGMTPAEIDKMLNKESGLKGICGASDLRDIEDREQDGDPQAKLALDMYTYRIRKYIGAYMAALGRIDALVFTAGVGENSPFVRWQTCLELAGLGIRLDATKNDVKARQLTEIQADDSPIKVLVIPTNEELEIASQTYEALLLS